MARNRRALLELLASIADGQPLVWDAAEATTAAAGDRLRDVRVIAGVADVHRSFTDDDVEPGEHIGGARVVGRIEPTPAPSAGQSTWGPFILRERLGSGSSAEVFRAYEPQLDREVAVKLFPRHARKRADLTASMLREARALARIRHEHVVDVYGADERDGRVGLWMELVRGRTLETELADRGTWSAREAGAAGQDLCRALAAVHGAGLVHGDVKAQNVVRQQGGRLVLMDLGAGQFREADPTSVRRAGTPLYLAPEVLAGGRPSVASDIYSLGVLLYHLVTGAYPVRATSMEELRTRHRAGEMVRLHDLRPDLDPAFVRVVERALAPNPADRFQSAGEMETALAHVLGSHVPRPAPAGKPRRRWVVPGMVIAALILAAVALGLLTRQPAVPRTEASVAVLPFRTIDGQEEAVPLSEGVSADLTSLLAKLPDVRVVSGFSVQQFRDSRLAPSEVGRTLGVRTLVAGFVQVSDDRISVHVELVDCATANQLWSQRFDRRTRDLFALQTEIARSIATALLGPLSSREAQLLEQQPMDYRAFELYSLGRYHWNKRTPDGLRRSIQYFTEAAGQDSSSALPYAGLSDAYVLSGVYGLRPAIEAQALAEEAALRAVELDSTLAEAYAALGSIRQEQLRWDEAESALVRAITLKPNYAPARHWYALYLTSHGRFDRAIEEMNVALSQDPLSVAMRAALGFIHYMKGDFQSAVEHYNRALELETDRDWLYQNLAIALLSAGAYQEALDQLAKVPSGSEITADLNAIRASVYALAGQPDTARESMAAAEHVPDTAPFSAIERAIAWFALRDDATGFVWLEQALEKREHDIQYLAVEPRFSRIREDARFRDLLQRAGLERVSEGRRQ